MKITVGVLFGGRSVENEISVVTASQVIESMDKDKYEIVPIYIAKSGKWYTSSALLDLKRYRYAFALERLYRGVFQIHLRRQEFVFEFRTFPFAEGCG